MIAEITPVILTYNEEANIARTLERLRWASEVIIVDSGSTDGTRRIASAYPNVRLIHRDFDTHAAQWRYAVHQTGIRTPWVLALDADYVLGEGFDDELRTLRPDERTSGYRARFIYKIEGVALRGSLYPPVTVLFRTDRGSYEQEGHTQRVRLTGRVLDLRTPIEHDDRKPEARWRTSQWKYAEAEADKLARERWSDSSWPDRLRRVPFVAAAIVWVYCLFVKGLCTQGASGWKYAAQRAYAEYALSVCLLRRYFRRPN